MSQGSHTLLVVHAHPDDESSGTGGLLRLTADRGQTTVLVTCTNGELGEVNGPALRLKPREHPQDRRQLAQIRRQELTQATALLGVTHLYMLGYHDSGMRGWETNQAREAFVRAEPDEVVARLVRIIRTHRPDIVVTYDENGGYGHPDHIMTHRVVVAAVQAAAEAGQWPLADTPWQVAKLYYTAWARSDMLRAFKLMHVLGMRTPLRDPNFDPNALGCPDELITTRIDVRSVLPVKWRALFTHRSQMGWGKVFWWFLRLTGRWLYPYESFRCVQSPTNIPRHEIDMFVGL
ncbi:Mycothiol S-conjugate amidase [Candidatus Entotheonellaceae bacterium PAL068K]